MWCGLLLLRSWAVLQVISRAEDPLDDEDDALIVYEGGAGGGEAQCTAPPGPVLVKDLVEEIGHDVSEEVMTRTKAALEAEGVVQTRQLLQLYPQDFDAVIMPLLLKSRLRRVRERGGRIPEDLIGHKKPKEEEAEEGDAQVDDAPDDDNIL
mmetsp:Transcript_3678/g.6585  ORF Transcript_3678/g.6585 Transcript_3678/m.6585 type:complete len:152 (-) Transcript_3678:110-565(-)